MGQDLVRFSKKMKLLMSDNLSKILSYIRSCIRFSCWGALRGHSVRGFACTFFKHTKYIPRKMERTALLEDKKMVASVAISGNAKRRLCTILLVCVENQMKQLIGGATSSFK